MSWIIYVAIAIVVVLVVARRLSKRTSKNEIAVVTVDGVLRYGGKKFNKSNNLEKLLGLLDKIAKRKPKAIVVRVNSPGGTVAASEELYSSFKTLRAKGIKVVALMQDVAASGGLYASMAADHIVAHPGTITGSIGVIIRWYELPEALDALKINVRTVQSGPHKDILSFARSATQEEKSLLEGMVAETYEAFCKTVSEARNLSEEKVKSFADGRILTGRQAKNLGLVDEIGGFKEAVSAARRLAGITEGKERIKLFRIKSSPIESLTSSMGLSNYIHDVLPDIELSGIPLWLMLR